MSKRILIIDDTEVVRKLVYHHFTAEGYEVLSAEDGPSGLKLARAEKPDFILLDVQMPGMTGYEVCRKLRDSAVTAQIPIAMLTGMSNISNMQAGFEAGADDYITKPFQPGELQVRVEALMRRYARLTEPTRTGEVIVVFSLRGGAGCSSLAVNLAVGLQQMWSSKTVLMDLALPTGLCDIMLDLKPTHNLATLAQRNISDVDEELIESILAQHKSGARLLAGIIDPMEAELVTDSLVSLTLEHLRNRTQYVVIDTAHSFSPPMLAALDQADRIIMPITPDINSARLASSTLGVFKALGYPKEKIDIIVNWTFPKSGIATARLEEFLGHSITTVIPHIPDEWSRAINSGTPVITSDPNSNLVELLENMVWQVSSDYDRSQAPEQRSETWTRVVQRKRQRSKRDR